MGHKLGRHPKKPPSDGEEHSDQPESTILYTGLIGNCHLIFSEEGGKLVTNPLATINSCLFTFKQLCITNVNPHLRTFVLKYFCQINIKSGNKELFRYFDT